MSRLFSDREGDDGLPGGERRLAVIALVLGTLMAVVDTTMINIALPSMARDLDISPSRAIWITNLFQVVCAAMLLVFAAASELLSRRKVYVGGIGLFTLAALGSALAPNFETLLVFRALQGVGAAATLSIGPSLYRMIFPSRLLGSALGLSSLVVAAGYAAGPSIGGLILSVARWPWLFALNLPLGLAAVVMAWRALPREAPREGNFDAIGAVSSMLMLGGLFMAMDAVGHRAPLLEIVGWVALTCTAMLGFVCRQRRASHPLLPLSLFREPRFRLAVGAQGTAFIGQGLTFVALSFLYQQEMGFSALHTAWLFTPWPLTIMLVGPLAGRLADRFNPALVATLGLVLLLMGLVSLASLPADAGVLDSLWRTALCGAGFGLFQPPNNRELMTSVPLARSANASGVMSTTRTVGQSLGVALVGLCLAAGTGVQQALWIGAATTLLALCISIVRVGRAGRAHGEARALRAS
ncbi:MFS transporter [Halomonas cupida]|uniref:MFS transporter n=1 Tax=Halomonas cupida TaxID=44933 RepID=A0A1M7M0P0_9GAMM|nr:MFS transporter [Halomonas cupida]GEN25678.1 MFS transporter [Halomonas cupida]SHM84091.1 MFS transporter, DHA2 family, multidrug resistance protein [Halomonas cupida]